MLPPSAIDEVNEVLSDAFGSIAVNSGKLFVLFFGKPKHVVVDLVNDLAAEDTNHVEKTFELLKAVFAKPNLAKPELARQRAYFADLLYLPPPKGNIKDVSDELFKCRSALLLAVVSGFLYERHFQEGKLSEAIRSLLRAQLFYGASVGRGAAHFRKNSVQSIALLGAKARLAKNAKAIAQQTAKENVRARWEEWRAKPSNYSSKAAFARDMLDKYEALTNQNVIVRWCGDWDRQSAG